MGKSSSADLRVRIVGEIERGQSCRAAALRFGVAPSTAIRLAQRKAQTGSLAPAKQGRPADWLGGGARRHYPARAGSAVMGGARGESGSVLAVAGSALRWFYRQKKRCWPAKPIALTSFAPGGCGECTASRG